jgi:hypothetical protein
MSSSLIPALDAITAVDGAAARPVTDGEQVGLVQALAVVADPVSGAGCATGWPACWRLRCVPHSPGR